MQMLLDPCWRDLVRKGGFQLFARLVGLVLITLLSISLLPIKVPIMTGGGTPTNLLVHIECWSLICKPQRVSAESNDGEHETVRLHL